MAAGLEILDDGAPDERRTAEDQDLHWGNLGPSQRIDQQLIEQRPPRAPTTGVRCAHAGGQRHRGRPRRRPCSRVDRALTILEMLAREGEAGVTEIAAELGVHKSTAFRLLATLESHRLVEQDGDRGRYRLGVGNLRLAGATTARLDLVTEARPVCRQLAADTGETVNITVRSETSALYLDQVAGSSALQSHNWVGQHIPLHATSNGKVLLSELSDADRKAALRELPRFTDKTVTSRSKLKDELERGPRGRVRRRGRRARDRAHRGRRARSATPTAMSSPP